MSDKEKCRVLIVDDHPIVRDGIIRLFECCSGIHVCGQTGDGNQVMEMVGKLKPDVIILDLTLESIDGLSLIGQINAKYPKLAILILSMHDELTHALPCIKAGARGYLMKKNASKEILEAINVILLGRIYSSESVKEQILHSFGNSRNTDNSVESLSPREFQIFRLYGQGFQTAHIASKLQCSPKTIETHCLRIRHKMNLQSINELIASAGAYVGYKSVC